MVVVSITLAAVSPTLAEAAEAPAVGTTRGLPVAAAVKAGKTIRNDIPTRPGIYANKSVMIENRMEWL